MNARLLFSCFTLPVIAFHVFNGDVSAQTAYDSFTPGKEWLADDGKHINAHACGIIYENGVYYWFGECKNGIGISLYTSTDLYNWKNEGLVFKPDGSVSGDIKNGCVMERPKVVKCEKTGKYVLWFHLELAGQGYSAARVATCVADKITGPYKFVRSFRPNGNMSRDQTIFVDDDGTGYHFYSSRENYDMRLHTMTDDFLDATDEDKMIFTSGAHREAPAIFKHDDLYYMITSGCTGWDPNEARYDITEDIWQQPWTTKGNPCTGPNNSKTFNGQSTFVLKVHGYEDAYIFIADIWNKNNLASSRYIWLPIAIKGPGEIEIKWRDSWTIEEVFGPPPVGGVREHFTVRSPQASVHGNNTSKRFTLLGQAVASPGSVRSVIPLVFQSNELRPGIVRFTAELGLTGK